MMQMLREHLDHQRIAAD